MQVRNNQETPYMLCGVLIPPGGVGEVDKDGYAKMLQVPAFRKVVDEKGIEVVGVQAVSPGLVSEQTQGAPLNPGLNTPNHHSGKTDKIK